MSTLDVVRSTGRLLRRSELRKPGGRSGGGLWTRLSRSSRSCTFDEVRVMGEQRANEHGVFAKWVRTCLVVLTFHLRTTAISSKGRAVEVSATVVYFQSKPLALLGMLQGPRRSAPPSLCCSRRVQLAGEQSNK